METLPLDILLYIIDILAGRDDEDVKSLRILSQVCKSMVPLCRKHLFSSLLLGCDSSSERFGNLLSKNPDIARYVRSLNYRVNKPISEHELNILDVLKERSSLQWISLSSTSTDWNSFPESIRSSLVSLIQLPYGGLYYRHQAWTGTPSLNRCDRHWYPCSICPQSPTSTSAPSKGFLQRHSQVVATSSTSGLQNLIWFILKSIISSHAVKS